MLMKAGADNVKSIAKKQKEIDAWMGLVHNQCRVLVFVDTHANSTTGTLQITGAVGTKPPKCVSVDVVSGPDCIVASCLTRRLLLSSCGCTFHW